MLAVSRSGPTRVGVSLIAVGALLVSMAAVMVVGATVADAASVVPGATTTGVVEGKPTISFGMPAGTVAGDLLIAQVAWMNGYDEPLNAAPCGFQTSASLSRNWGGPSGSDMAQTIFWKIATGGESWPCSWTQSEGAEIVGGMIRYPGPYEGPQLQISAWAEGDSRSLTIPSISDAPAGILLAFCVQQEEDNKLTLPSGWSQIYKADNKALDKWSILAADREWDGGNTPSGVVAGTDDGKWICQSVLAEHSPEDEPWCVPVSDGYESQDFPEGSQVGEQGGPPEGSIKADDAQGLADAGINANCDDVGDYCVPDNGGYTGPTQFTVGDQPQGSISVNDAAGLAAAGINANCDDVSEDLADPGPVADPYCLVVNGVNTLFPNPTGEVRPSGATDPNQDGACEAVSEPGTLPDTGPGQLLAALMGGIGLLFMGSGSLVIASDRRREDEVA